MNSKDLSEVTYLNFLCSGLGDCRKEKRFCDVKLKIGEKVFECHRVILASNSQFFTALFKDEFEVATDEIKCLSTEYVDEASFSKLLDAMYGKPLEINNEDLVPLFTTSMFLQLTYFIDEITRYVVQNLDKIDLSELIVLPEMKLVTTLSRSVQKHVCHHFPKYYSRLAGISLDILGDLLSDPELFVINTKQLFDFGKNWVAHDIKYRKQHLPLIASLLKPFHTPSKQSLKIVSDMENFMQDEYAVEICLKTLLESSDDLLDNASEKLKLSVSSSLFFIQPNDESEVVFGTFENDSSWKFLNEFHLPMPTALLKTYDGAVVNDALYFAAERKQFEDNEGSSASSRTFHRWVGETQEWMELMPPRKMPECLIPCNSMLFLYEHSVDDHQFSFYEPLLNRWLKVPAVNYPRTHAGIATDNEIIYMIGGKPLKTISSEMPKNIIEMYDSRCGHWSRVIIPSEQEIIKNHNYHKTVCFSDNKLFILNWDKTLVRIDSRTRKVLGIDDLKSNFTADEWNWNLIASNRRELWIVNEKGSHNIEIFGTDGEKLEPLPHANVFMRPISMSRW